MSDRRSTTGDGKSSPSRRERKKAKTRDRIYETSIRLFRTEGYDNVTVERITERADVAKGTFFNYFPNKLRILTTYWSEIAEELLSYGESQRSRSSRTFFKGFFRHLESRVQADKRIFVILIREVLLQPELQALNESLTTRGFALYRKALESGVASGEVRHSIDFAVVSSLIEDAWIGTLRSWNFSDYAFPLRATFEKKLDLLFDGLCPRQISGRTCGS